MMDFVEKRKYPRIDVRISLNFKELYAKNPSHTTALTRDLSEGGIKFNSEKFISLSCRMICEISLPAIEKPLRAISKVAWIRKLSAGDNYEIGNQFLDMTKEDRRLINDFVKKTIDSSSKPQQS